MADANVRGISGHNRSDPIVGILIGDNHLKILESLRRKRIQKPIERINSIYRGYNQ